MVHGPYIHACMGFGFQEHMVVGYEGGWFTQNPGGDEDASTILAARMSSTCGASIDQKTAGVCVVGRSAALIYLFP